MSTLVFSTLCCPQGGDGIAGYDPRHCILHFPCPFPALCRPQGGDGIAEDDPRYGGGNTFTDYGQNRASSGGALDEFRGEHNSEDARSAASGSHVSKQCDYTVISISISISISANTQ